MKLFALGGAGRFGTAVAKELGMPLSPLEERGFEDGEHKARPLVSVRGEDVYLIQHLTGDGEQSINDRLVRLLFMLATLKDDGAARITAVLPYLAYARKDRQTKARDPVATRTLARLIEAVGADAVVVLDVHNVAAYQNAFRCANWHLDSTRLFSRHLKSVVESKTVTVVSPDAGGVKRAQLFREMMERVTGQAIGSAFMEKRRTGGRVSGTHLVGDTGPGVAIMIDDLIASGGTMVRAARALKERGATEVIAVAAHGLFTDGAAAALADPAVDRWLVTDSVPSSRWPREAASRVEIVSVAPLFAEAIRRLNSGGSLVELLDFPT